MAQAHGASSWLSSFFVAVVADVARIIHDIDALAFVIELASFLLLSSL